jgi:hypothetical protein
VNVDLDVRLRDDPECPFDLRTSLADFADEWPSAEQLGILREAIRAHLASEEQLPRLRSPASGTSKQLRSALENDVEELPSENELIALRQKVSASLLFSSGTKSRFASKKKRSWLRVLLVAALIALPAAAAAFVGYKLIVSGRTRTSMSLSAVPTVGPPPRARRAVSPVAAPSVVPSLAPSQFVSAPRAKASVAKSKPADGAVEENEFELIGQARERMKSSPTEALALLSRHARWFPAGVLVQERELIAIESLVRLGRDAEANARAQRFAARFPGSAHLQRLKRLLGPDASVNSFGF